MSTRARFRINDQSAHVRRSLHMQVQNKVEVADRTLQMLAKVIRPAMPDQHREFFERQAVVYLGSRGPAGSLVAGMLIGSEGTTFSPDSSLTALLAICMRQGSNQPPRQLQWFRSWLGVCSSLPCMPLEPAAAGSRAHKDAHHLNGTSSGTRGLAGQLTQSVEDACRRRSAAHLHHQCKQTEGYVACRA